MEHANMFFTIVLLSSVLFSDNFVKCKILYHENLRIGLNRVDGKLDRHFVRESVINRGGAAGYTPQLINIDSASNIEDIHRISKRAATPRPTVNFHQLKDKDHNEAIIHWSGRNSTAIFILTRRRQLSTDEVVDSRLYRSVNYGKTYADITHNLANKTKAVAREFYVSPTDPEILIFTDRVNKMLYVTQDEGDHFQAVHLVDSPDVLVFHPNVTKKKWLLRYSDETNTLYASENLGLQNWVTVQTFVNPRFSWAIPDVDRNDTMIHMEVQDPYNQGMYHFKTCDYPYCTDVTHDRSIGSIDISSMLALNEYIFVQKTTEDNSALYVSYKMTNGERSRFELAYFPNNFKIKDCVVLDADQHEVFLAVKSPDAISVTLFVSDSTGRFYVKTLENIKHIPLTAGFYMDFAEIRGIPGRYITNQYTTTVGYETKMTFDQGRTWQTLEANPKDWKKQTICSQSTCKLTLYMSYFLSEENAPGLIFAQGFTTSISQNYVYMSSDAGVTWTQLHEGTYQTIIMDQGGAIVMVPPTRGGKTTTDLLYSNDEGQSWKSMPFSGTQIFVDGVVTEPGINTLVVTLFGHKNTGVNEGWFVQTLNFAPILNNTCNVADYIPWTLTKKGKESEKSCILGQVFTYKRRKPTAYCINGNDYHKGTAKSFCQCTTDDFECDYGYKQTSAASLTCKEENWFTTRESIKVILMCSEGERFLKSWGYRKISSDKCTGGVDKKYKPELTICPTLLPTGLKIESIKSGVVPVGKKVTFTLLQEMGSKNSTSYIWSNGTSNASVTYTGYSKGSSFQTTYNKPGKYIVSVTAKNSVGSANVTYVIRVQEPIRGLYIRRKHGARINKLIRFTVFLEQGNIESSLFLWTFGDEHDPSIKPVATWSGMVGHLYTEVGHKTLRIEALNSISSVYKTMDLYVYADEKVLQLTFNEEFSALRTTNVSILWLEDFGLRLHKYLTEALSVAEEQIEVDVLIPEPRKPTKADVSVFPPQKQGPSIDKLVESIKHMVDNRSLSFIYDERRKLKVTAMSYKSVSADDSTKPNKSNMTVAVAVATPILLVAIIATAFVCVCYRRKLLRPREYRMLNRPNDGPLLENDDDDDDDPMIDANPDHRSDNRLDDDENLQPFGSSSLVMMADNDQLQDNTVMT